MARSVQLPTPARDTMEILGHSRPAVTLEIYTAAADASRRDAIERLNQLFEQGPRPVAVSTAESPARGRALGVSGLPRFS